MLKNSMIQIMKMNSKINMKNNGLINKANQTHKGKKNKAQCKPSNPSNHKINQNLKFI